MRLLYCFATKSALSAAVIILAALAWSVRADYSSTVLSQGPVGYWRLNETVQPPALPIVVTNEGSLGTAADGDPRVSPVRGEPGALVGSTNTCYRFSNPGWLITYVGSRVDVLYKEALNPDGPFSVEFWANPSPGASDLFATVCSLDGLQNNLTSRNGYVVYLDGANSRWTFRTGGTNGYNGDISGGSATAGVWHHVVAVYSGTNLTLYVDGAQAATGAVNANPFNRNTSQPFRIGATTLPNRTFDGLIDEVAFYGSALDPATIKAHFDAAATNSAGYATQVLAANPAGYWRLGEPGDPAVANLGTLGAAGDGRCVFNAESGATGPVFEGFDSSNSAVAFDGAGGGYVSVPALKLDTNTITITGWLCATNPQTALTGLIVSRSGSTAAGLTIDAAGGYGLTYNWNNDPATYNRSSGLSLQDSTWCFVALVVQPEKAAIYLGNGTNYSTFSSATNYISHANQGFEGPTLFGADLGFFPSRYFNGAVDEVAIFNRSLSAGEVYSEYAAAVGGVPVRIFSQSAAPVNLLLEGDTLTLAVDAGGTPNLTYQWRKDGAAIADATASVYTKPRLQDADSGSYDVVVANGIGLPQTSDSALVTVIASSAPMITESPVSRTLYPGGTLALAVVGSGGGLSYQWQKDGSAISGATNSSYVVSSVSAGDAGTYLAIVTNNLGTASTTPAVISVTSPAAGSYAALVTADGPEGWWRLGETPGSAIMPDAMGRHDGYYTNLSSTTVALGLTGAIWDDTDTAASFDGTSDCYGLVPFSTAINSGDITVECWANTTVTNECSPVSSRYGYQGYWFNPDMANPSGWGLSLNAGNTDYRVASTAARGALQDGWTHLVMTYSASLGLRLYINGEWDGVTYINFDRNGAGPMLIGARGTAPGQLPDELFNGKVDEVAVYRKALSPDRIQAHYLGRYGIGTKPIFKTQPTSQVVSIGASIFLSAVVEGSSPMAYQWYKDGTALSGATTATLSLSNAVFDDTGSYQLIVTNSAGSTGSTAVPITVVPPPAFANATNDLVMHLRFNGDYNDASGRGNNGTPIGGPAFSAGIIGSGALHYSTDTAAGLYDYVSLGAPPDLSFGANSFSIALWVKLPAGYLGSDLPFIGSAYNSANNKGLTISPSFQLGGWQWCLNDGVVNIDVNGPGNAINDGNWHHFALTVDRASRIALTFLDGLQVQSTMVSGLGAFDNGNSFSLGQDPTGAYGESGAADLDDLGVWKRVLSPFDVYSIYYSGVNYGASLDAYGPVKLVIVASGDRLVLYWQAGTLLQADNLDGQWTEVSGAVAPAWVVTPGTGNKFFRVKL